MMLSDGVLHCDPHPGNLLRTAGGRLCILDWGLVTSIEPELQLTLIEHVAHLTAEDYAKARAKTGARGVRGRAGVRMVASSAVKPPRTAITLAVLPVTTVIAVPPSVMNFS